VTSLLGVRREGGALVIDPVLPPELSGLRAEVSVLGRRVEVEYRVDRLGHSPRRLVLNGGSLPFDRVPNPYRAGGAAIPLEAWRAQLHPAPPDHLRVELS
jgi:cellobiose phosphorylase